MGVLETGTFTNALTNGSLTLTSSMGVRKISVYNTTSVSASILGTKSLSDVASTSISLGENETFVFTSIGGEVITGLTITAPASCTLNIVALV